MYRSRLADQRMMIVLDNAATEAQATPLLPGAPGCLVLVTSRRRLVGLDHTHTLSLDTLPPPDAVTLLRHTAGESRLAGQPPDVAAQLVELCGRLPLAIRIAAARLRSHPTWDLSHLADLLRDRQRLLVELEAGQRSVTATLDLSYQDLSAGQRRLYRLLGLHPGPTSTRTPRPRCSTPPCRRRGSCSTSYWIPVPRFGPRPRRPHRDPGRVRVRRVRGAGPAARPARAHWQHALEILTRLGTDHTTDEETNVAAIRAHLGGRYGSPQ